MDQIVSVGEAARILGLCEDTVRRLADDGRLPVTRTSNGFRIFERRAVEQLAERRAQERAAR